MFPSSQTIRAGREAHGQWGSTNVNHGLMPCARQFLILEVISLFYWRSIQSGHYAAAVASMFRLRCSGKARNHATSSFRGKKVHCVSVSNGLTGEKTEQTLSVNIIYIYINTLKPARWIV